LHIYGKLLKGKEFARGMYKITTSLPGYEHVKELILLSNDTLNKKNLEEYVKKSYEKFAIQGIDENKVAFISGAAAHTTCFFSKMRKKEKLYYLFDSAPARSMGGAYTTGTMEVHDHLGSLIDSLKSRWRMFHFNFREGNIYTVTTLHNVHDKNLNAYLSARSFACFKNYSL
jgi:hypothetical protein